MMKNDEQQTIAALNDAFRCSIYGLYGMRLTQGVQLLDDIEGLIEAVGTFDGFTEGNDPYHEHDFGSLDWNGSKVFWKIDYYDQNLECWCDPLLPECNRILTVMLASEY